MTNAPDPVDQAAERFRTDIELAVPALAGAALCILGEGWHSTAVLANNQTVFRFPKDDLARTSLRREAGILAAVGPYVTLPIPAMTLHDSPRLMSSHPLLRGDQLMRDDYLRLTAPQRDGLARDLARFHAELHRMNHDVMVRAGALPVWRWPTADAVRDVALPLLQGEVAALAMAELGAYAALPPDPLGEVFGFFDGHGWNMAFDHNTGRLNGIYDVGDSGFGPLQQEFIYSGLISPDLTTRLVTAYEAETGLTIDRRRVGLLFGIHRLAELAESVVNGQDPADMLRAVKVWAKDHVLRCT